MSTTVALLLLASSLSVYMVLCNQKNNNGGHGLMPFLCMLRGPLISATYEYAFGLVFGSIFALIMGVLFLYNPDSMWLVLSN